MGSVDRTYVNGVHAAFAWYSRFRIHFANEMTDGFGLKMHSTKRFAGQKLYRPIAAVYLVWGGH